MDHFTKQDLHDLIQTRGGPLISLYMPMNREPDKSEEDRIRLKNLLAKADDLIVGEQDLNRESVEKALDELRRQDKNGKLWRPRAMGLAVFVGPGFFRSYRLQIAFDELLIAGERFHLKPLLPLLMEDGRYFVLTLSQKSPRLYQGSRGGLLELDVPGLPSSIDEVLRYDDPQKQLQFHTGTQARPGSRDARFHGQGVGHDGSKQKLERFVQAMHRPLYKFLAGRKQPLVLVGTEPLLPIFKNDSGGLSLSEIMVDKNPGSLNEQELHALTWQSVEPVFAERREQDKERYHEMRSKGMASDMVRQIVPAAAGKRIETLFVARGRRIWGKFDAQSGQVTVSDKMKPGLHDLLDLAAMDTIEAGGTVYALPPDQVPGGGPAAATMRF